MPQKSPAVDDINAVIDTWFAECMHQPPIAYSVESYNQAHAAHAELKRRLCLLITGEEPEIPKPAVDSQAPQPEPVPATAAKEA